MEKYVLRTQEAILVPVEPTKVPPIVKKIVIVAWIAIGVLSLLFRTNILKEMSGLAVVMLIGLSCVLLFSSPKTEFSPSYMELHFCEDKLVLYRPQIYYDERCTRREICEMKYTDITSCVYKVRSKRIHIYGDGVTVWYDMKIDGTFPDQPTKVKHYKSGLMFFSTQCAEGVDFVKEFEDHSPIRVIKEDK